MIYKCSLTIVIGEDDDSTVISHERYAANPVVGVQCLMQTCLEDLSLQWRHVPASTTPLQLLGWVDPVIDRSLGENNIIMQRMLDRAKRKEGDVRAATEAPVNNDRPQVSLDPVGFEQQGVIDGK